MPEDTTTAAGRWPDGAEATRRALLNAAAEQFYEAGYHGGSVSEIVARAGLTKGALYFHFPDKRALAEAVIAEMNTTYSLLAERVSAAGEDPLMSMLAICDEIVTHLLTDPVVAGGSRLQRDPLLRSRHTADLAALRYDVVHDTIATQLAAAEAAGLLQPEIGAQRRDELAAMIVAAIAGYHLIGELAGNHAPLWDHLRAMWTTLLPAIATRTWLRQWRESDWTHRPQPSLTPPTYDGGGFRDSRR